MTQAKRDNNNVKTMIGVLNTNGNTPTLLKALPTGSHLLDIMDGATGSDFNRNDATRDENEIPVMLAISSVDGSTIVPLYVSSSGHLLIQST